MAKSKKYYVVWIGRNPGIYPDWLECKIQIDNFEGAKYKSFESLDEAIEANRKSYKDYYNFSKPKINTIQNISKNINSNAICVDASCLGNPGLMEYRGVDMINNKEIFRRSGFVESTQNIGEFLAIVHGLTYLMQNNSDKIIYSDSLTAISWVQKKNVKTTLTKSDKNEMSFHYIENALKWLKNNSFSTNILKWDTVNWGEIPADFGRK